MVARIMFASIPFDTNLRNPAQIINSIKQMLKVRCKKRMKHRLKVVKILILHHSRMIFFIVRKIKFAYCFVLSFLFKISIRNNKSLRDVWPWSTPLSQNFVGVLIRFLIIFWRSKLTQSVYFLTFLFFKSIDFSANVKSNRVAHQSTHKFTGNSMKIVYSRKNE